MRSPWRSVFDTVRLATGTHRDADGTVASINWLRREMERRGANPNVVRNVIYRDKGRLEDKRVLWEILQEVWTRHGSGPLEAPEIEVLIRAHGNAEHDMLRILQREKRQAFRSFVRRVRDGGNPKLLVLGRPGSGKTLLVDHIERALELPPVTRRSTIRLEFGRVELTTSLLRLADALGVRRSTMDARLAKVARGGAFAVQAEAIADLAATIVDAVSRAAHDVTLLLHVSRAASNRWTLGDADLRLATHDVPRVHEADWLWHALLEPMSKIDQVALLASTSEPWTHLERGTGGFGTPVHLAPPSHVEARKFVRSRMRTASSAAVDDVVKRAGRSFEELRTLTLLAEARGALPARATRTVGVARSTVDGVGAIDELVRLAELDPDEPLGSFLRALAVVALPEDPTFTVDDLAALRPPAHAEIAVLERAFLDDVPGEGGRVRCFSRELASRLRAHLASHDPDGWRRLHAKAAETTAGRPSSPVGSSRRTLHLLAAERWADVARVVASEPLPLDLLRRTWEVASRSIADTDTATLDAVALAVAERWTTVASTRRREVAEALDVLRRSHDRDVRARVVLWEIDDAMSRHAWDEARAHLERHPVPVAKELAAWWTRQAVTLDVEQGRLERAVTRWHDAGLTTDEAPSTWCRVLLAQGRIDEAHALASTVDTACTAHENAVEALRLLADCDALRGRWSDAVRTSEALLARTDVASGRPWEHADDRLRAARAQRAVGAIDAAMEHVEVAGRALLGVASADDAFADDSGAPMSGTVSHVRAAWALQQARQALHAGDDRHAMSWASKAAAWATNAAGQNDDDASPPSGLRGDAVQTVAEAHLARCVPRRSGRYDTRIWTALAGGDGPDRVDDLAVDGDALHATSLLAPWLTAPCDARTAAHHRDVRSWRRARLLAARAASTDRALAMLGEADARSTTDVERWAVQAHAWFVRLRRGDHEAIEADLDGHPGWAGPARLRAWFHAVAVRCAMPEGPTRVTARALARLGDDDLPLPWKREIVTFASAAWRDDRVVAAVPSTRGDGLARPRDRWLDALESAWRTEEERP